MTKSRLLRTAALISAGVLVAGLTACSVDQPVADPTTSSPSPTSTPTSDPAPTSSPTTDPAPTQLPSEGQAAGTEIRVIVGDQVLGAILWDNAAAQSLVAQLPITLEFSPYGSQEVTATPPAPITMDGMPEGDAPVAGDIGYYAPDGVLTFHFSDIGYWTGSARLGSITGDFSVLQEQSGPFSVAIERAG